MRFNDSTAAGRGEVVGLCSVNVECDVLAIVGSCMQRFEDVMKGGE